MNFFFFLIVSVLLANCQSSPSVSSTTFSPKIHGHRGSRGTHPENTLLAFEEALLAGSDFLELDLVMSSDGVPFVSHDPIISFDLCLDEQLKPLNQKFLIGQLTTQDIKKFQCGSVPHPLFPEQQVQRPASLLTLEEFLHWFSLQKAPNVHLNLETKMEVPKGARKPSPKNFSGAVLKLLRKYHLIEKTILQSFDFRTLKEARKKEPGIKISLLFEKQTSFCDQAKKLGAQIISPEFSLLSEKEVKKCHSMGIEVHPWTLNQESQWAQAIQWKVDGIITDYPRKLKTYMKNNKT